MTQPHSDSREAFLKRLDALPLDAYFVELPDLEPALDDEADQWSE